MKLNGATLYVVAADGITRTNLLMLADSIRGGTKVSEIAVYTDENEAQAEYRRRQFVKAGIATLERLDLSDLEVMVPALEKEALDRSVDRTMEKVLG